HLVVHVRVSPQCVYRGDRDDRKRHGCPEDCRDQRATSAARGSRRDPDCAGSQAAVGDLQTGQSPRPGDRSRAWCGGQAGTDWSTVTGIYLTVQTTDNASGVVVSFDDLFLIGGAGPDTTEPGASKYDYRVVNYDPRTGARSNGSPIQGDAGDGLPPDQTLWLDSLRSPIKITPPAYGDAAMRQEAYRRGGTLVDRSEERRV